MTAIPNAACPHFARCASRCAAALRLIYDAPPIDLLLTDVVLPGGMNGRQLRDEVLRRRPAIKVLYMTGYTRNAIIHHGRLDPGHSNPPMCRTCVLPDDVPHDPGEVHRRSREPGTRRPLQGEQIVHQPGQPPGIALELLKDLGIGTMTRGELGVAEQRGDRRAQLVRGVGQKAPLAGAGILERREHTIQDPRQLPDLVRRARLRKPA